jgi:hypothetical protein
MSDALTSASSEPEWAAFAAIDWADKKNFWRLLPTSARRSEEGELENSPEAVEAWAASLQRRFGGRPIAVILEQSRGAMVYMPTKSTPGAVPGPPYHCGAVPGNLHSLQGQERSQ